MTVVTSRVDVRVSRRVFASITGCAALVIACPALAQPASINPGLIANESRRQQQRMERDLARQQRQRPESYVTIDRPTVHQPTKPRPKRKRR